MKECVICNQQKKKYEFIISPKGQTLQVCRLCDKKLEKEQKKWCKWCRKVKPKLSFISKTKCTKCQVKPKKTVKKVIIEQPTIDELRQKENDKLKKGYKWINTVLHPGTSFETKIRKLVKI